MRHKFLKAMICVPDSPVLVLQSPGMAAQLAQTQQIANSQSPEQRERLLRLKSDPELKEMFDDIESKGPGLPLLSCCCCC